mgnify:CR=1 FL=1
MRQAKYISPNAKEKGCNQLAGLCAHLLSLQRVDTVLSLLLQHEQVLVCLLLCKELGNNFADICHTSCFLDLAECCAMRAGGAGQISNKDVYNVSKSSAKHRM